jgi:PPP family 3-phenylpropionic acid transporter
MLRPMRAGLSLASFWFFYFGGLGIFFPFYSLYLHENAGLTGTEVGVVLAVIPLVGSFAQLAWGQLADRTGARTHVLTLVAIGAAVGYWALGTVTGFTALLIVTAALALFSMAVVPVGVSVSFAALRDAGPHAFGFVRAFGTFGFLVLVVGFPPLLHRLQAARGLTPEPGGPSEPGLEAMFAATGVLVFVAAVVALALPRGGHVGLRAERGDWRRLLREGAVIRLALFTFIAYGLLQGPMGLFPVFIRAHGGDMDTVGRMWILMLLLEIPLVLLSGTGLLRLGPRGLLAIGVLAAAVRWIICGLSDDLRIIYPVQLLHGVTVVGLLMGAPLYLDAVAPERLRSTGQTMLAMVGIGWGGTASNAGAGWLLENVGANAPYLVGGFGALVLACLVTWILPRPDPVRPLEPGEVDEESQSYLALEV